MIPYIPISKHLREKKKVHLQNQDLYIFSTTPSIYQMSGSFLPLSHFIQRSRILSLYRKTLRCAGQQEAMSNFERNKIKLQITTEYRKHQHLTEQSHIRMCLVKAEEQATFLSSGVAPSKSDPLDGLDGTQDKWNRLGGQDDNDILGRPGQGWPWGKKK